MFLKSKIGLTILSLYEIIAVILLHNPKTCNIMFGVTFCYDAFKYFVWCVAVPLIVFLIVMWIMDIVDTARRRHSLLYKAKHAVKQMASNIHDRVSEHISSKDMEKMVTAALVMGLKKYSERNPRARSILNGIMNDDIEAVEYDEYYSDVDDEEMLPHTSKNKKTKSNKYKK